jgi:uncharacterized protein (DUF4415 family)
MSANKRGLQSDLAKTDARALSESDYGEVPELGPEFFQTADENLGGVLIRRGRGRPPGSKKEQMNLRIDRDVIEAYRSQGEGWQTRMNEALRYFALSHGMMSEVQPGKKP